MLFWAILISVFLLAWVINHVIGMNKAYDKIEELMDKRDPWFMEMKYASIDEVCDWYASWGGTRWWFQEFKPPVEGGGEGPY